MPDTVEPLQSSTSDNTTSIDNTRDKAYRASDGILGYHCRQTSQPGSQKPERHSAVSTDSVESAEHLKPTLQSSISSGTAYNESFLLKKLSAFDSEEDVEGSKSGAATEEMSNFADSLPPQPASALTSKTESRTNLWSTVPAGNSPKSGSSERIRRLSDEEDEGPSFYDYLQSEFNPAPLYPSADAIWGQTERQRV